MQTICKSFSLFHAVADFKVHQYLVEALASRPAARQLILRLGAIDLPSGAPPIKQLHSHTVITEDSMAQYLATAFNYPATYTNALVIVDQQQIHVHKVIMARMYRSGRSLGMYKQSSGD